MDQQLPAEPIKGGPPLAPSTRPDVVGMSGRVAVPDRDTSAEPTGPSGGIGRVGEPDDVVVPFAPHGLVNTVDPVVANDRYRDQAGVQPEHVDPTQGYDPTPEHLFVHGDPAFWPELMQAMRELSSAFHDFATTRPQLTREVQGSHFVCVTHDFTSTGIAGIQRVLPADPNRRRAVLLATAFAVQVGESREGLGALQAAPTAAGNGFVCPVAVPIELLGTGELWALCQGGAGFLSVTVEYGDERSVPFQGRMPRHLSDVRGPRGHRPGS